MPTHRWLEAGGHDALDPFVALAFCAAVTERMRLIPDILVLPYRNPFLTAKAVASIDALSDGRFILAVATGYLRGEYRALGVDFEERNALFDQAIDVMRGIWTEDDYAYEGHGFLAHGQTVNPKPDPQPPIWIGGNSRLSRRRVARYGDGWSPFPAPPQLATTAKTPALETVQDLAAMLDELWGYVDDAGGTLRVRRVLRDLRPAEIPARQLRRRRAARSARRARQPRRHLVRAECREIVAARARDARAVRRVGDPAVRSDLSRL